MDSLQRFDRTGEQIAALDEAIHALHIHHMAAWGHEEQAGLGAAVEILNRIRKERQKRYRRQLRSILQRKQLAVTLAHSSPS